MDEPGAVNEGTADSMAASETGRSEIGGFSGATSATPTKSLRDMADSSAGRSCHGNGTQVTQFGGGGVINGFDGEVHDDGEIWNGFFWEIFDGLRTAGVKACSGKCEAGPAIQHKALGDADAQSGKVLSRVKLRVDATPGIAGPGDAALAPKSN